MLHLGDPTATDVLAGEVKALWAENAALGRRLEILEGQVAQLVELVGNARQREEKLIEIIDRLTSGGEG